MMVPGLSSALLHSKLIREAIGVKPRPTPEARIQYAVGSSLGVFQTLPHLYFSATLLLLYRGTHKPGHEPLLSDATHAWNALLLPFHESKYTLFPKGLIQAWGFFRKSSQPVMTFLIARYGNTDSKAKCNS